MGRISGVLKKGNKVIDPLPVYLYDDYSLSNLLFNSRNYVNNILKQTKVMDSLLLTDEEHDSFNLHYEYQFAEEELDYRTSIGEKLPSDYKTTYLKFDSSVEKYIYKEEFQDYEYWSEIPQVISGLEKLHKIMMIEKERNINTPWNGYHLDENLSNIEEFKRNLEQVNKTSGAEKILIVLLY